MPLHSRTVVKQPGGALRLIVAPGGIGLVDAEVVEITVSRLGVPLLDSGSSGFCAPQTIHENKPIRLVRTWSRGLPGSSA